MLCNVRWIACDEPSLVRIDRYTSKTSYAISLVLCECSLSLLTHFTPSAHSLTLFPSPLLSSGLTNYHSWIPFFFLLFSLSSPLCDCVCVFVNIISILSVVITTLLCPQLSCHTSATWWARTTKAIVILTPARGNSHSRRSFDWCERLERRLRINPWE
jgi:hypothetical protein